MSFVFVRRSYKHLGAQVADDGSHEPEHAARTISAAAALRPLQKKVHAAPEISISTKCHLGQSLVLSRLLLYAGTWPEVTAAALAKPNQVFMNLYRSIARRGRHLPNA